MTSRRRRPGPENQQPADQESTSQAPAGQESTSQESTGQEPAGQQPADQESADPEPASQEPAGQQPADQESADQESTGQEPAGQEPADQESADQESTGQEPAGQEPAGQQPADQESADQEPASQEPAGQEPADQIQGSPITWESGDWATSPRDEPPYNGIRLVCTPTYDNNGKLTSIATLIEDYTSDENGATKSFVFTSIRDGARIEISPDSENNFTVTGPMILRFPPSAADQLVIMLSATYGLANQQYHVQGGILEIPLAAPTPSPSA